MTTININTLSPEEIRTRLPRFDGIDQEIANRLSARAAEGLLANETAFAGPDALADALREAGVAEDDIEGLLELLSAGEPPLGQRDEPFEFPFVLDPENFVEIDDENPIPAAEIETVPTTPERPPWWGTDWPFPKSNRPLVVVPGIMGSRLHSISQGHPRLRWPPLTPEGIHILKDLEDQIKFKQLRASSGDTLGSYSDLLTELANKGYRQNVNLLFFTYNWTQSNKISGGELAVAIAAFLTRFNRLFGTSHDEVDVICHSMGGLVTKVAIGQGAKVRRTAYIATPHYGSPKAYFALHPDIGVTGLAVELVFDLFNLFLGREDYDDLGDGLHSLARLCDSVWELLPNKFYVDTVKMLRIENKSGHESYRKGRNRVYFSDKWQLPIGDHHRAKRALDFVESLGATPPGEHLLIVGPNIRTEDQIEYNLDFVGSDEFESPEASPRQGDGTVPTYSACAAAGSSPHRFITDVGHTEMPNHPGVFRILESYLDL